MRWLLALILLPSAAAAQDCANPMTQAEMTQCAGLAYDAADGDLNLAWGMARDAAKSMDAKAADYGGPQDHFDILLDAQRKWISYRDAACSAESLIARGGSMQNMIFLNCMEKLTRERTEDLRFFGEMN